MAWEWRAGESCGDAGAVTHPLHGEVRRGRHPGQFEDKLQGTRWMVVLLAGKRWGGYVPIRTWGAGSLTISGTPRAGLQPDFESWSLRDWGLESHETMSTEGEFCAEGKLRAIPLSGSWLEGRVGR